MTKSLLWKMAIEIVDCPTKNMVIFRSYVKLPEGINHIWLLVSSHLKNMSQIGSSIHVYIYMDIYIYIYI